MERIIKFIVIAFFAAFLIDLNTWTQQPKTEETQQSVYQPAFYTESEPRSGWKMSKEESETSYYLTGISLILDHRTSSSCTNDFYDIYLLPKFEKNSEAIQPTIMYKDSNMAFVFQELERIEYQLMIKSQFGIVKVFMANDDWYVFEGTLTKLDPLLPEHLFFRATRNIIVHRQQILSISSASFGKILVKIKEPQTDDLAVFVSRLKAAAFRKWYHSSSPTNL